MPTCYKIGLLLVEDDESVRLVMAMMLEDLGFTVSEASTGEAALELFHSGPAVDMLVTDINLGAGTNGLRLADQIRTLRPRLPVVFVTGRPVMLQGRARRESEAYLPKPFGSEALARAVHSLLPVWAGVGRGDRGRLERS